MLRKIIDFFSRKDSKQQIEKTEEVNWANENSQFKKNFKERQSRVPESMEKDTSDYLAMAATAKIKAAEALDRNEFDVAWKLEHERIQHYTNHALKQGFSTNETFALLSTVYSSLSSILLAEGKHALSLAFYLYTVQCEGIANEGVRFNIRRICRIGKLKHFESNIEEFLNSYVSKDKVKQADLRFCQSEVSRWESESPFYSNDTQKMILNYINTPGYLSLVGGVSKNIEKALLENNVKTIEELIEIEPEELIKIKGIGKAVLLKINNSTAFIKA